MACFSFRERLPSCCAGGGDEGVCVGAGVGAGLERGAWRTVWLGSSERNVANCAGVMTLESVRNSSSCR